MLQTSLRPNDIVELVAPGSKKCFRALERCVETLKSWGLRPRYGAEIYGEHFLYVNTTPKRFENLREALFEPDSKVLWAIRGGFGATRLIPYLERLDPPPHQKTLIGFSDITALHLFLHQKWGWRTIHGPNIRQIADQELSEDSVRLTKDLLFGRAQELWINGFEPLNSAASQEKILTGPLTGGNLSLVQTSIGTSWELEGRGKLLFLEDVDEKPYRTAERLEHLRQAGIFEGVQAVLFGDFNFYTPVDPIHTQLYPKMFKEFAEEMEIPVLSCTQFGHGKVNLPLVMGAEGALSLGKTGTLKTSLSKVAA